MGDIQDYSTTKYLITVEFVIHGVVERSDIVGALFGQTEGLLGDDLDLRELQKSGRIGRIQVTHKTKDGLSTGQVIIPSSLDKVETAVLAATIESVDRVGPCVAEMKLDKIEDVREEKRKKIMDRAAELLKGWDQEQLLDSQEITDNVKTTIRVGEIQKYGSDELPAGPSIDSEDELVVVEGRADILNLLRCGIKNCIAVQGTSIPQTVIDLSKKKTVTAYLDGDRGGDIILNELLQVADIEFVARAPDGLEVEELTRKQLIKALNAKVSIETIDNKFNKKYKKSAAPAKSQGPPPQKKPPKKKKSKKYTSKRKESPAKAQKIDIPDPLLEKIKGLVGTNEAVGFDQNHQLLFNASILTLVPALETGEIEGKKINGVKTLIFDGIISQRIVDLTVKKELDLVIGSTVRKIKVPKNAKTKFYSFNDFR